MNSGRIIIIFIHNVIYNLGQSINQAKKEEEANKETTVKNKIEKKTNHSELIDTYLENTTNDMIEEYIEKNNKICELAENLDSFYDNRSIIPTQ